MKLSDELTVWVTDIEPIFEYINEYGFPSLGPGYRVQVQIPKYRSRFPSTVMGWLNIGDSYSTYILDSYSSNEKVGLGLGCLTSSSSRISSMSSSSGSEVISNMVFINKFYHMSTINSESTNILKDFMRAFNVSPHCYFIKLNPRKKATFKFCLPALLGIHRNLKQKEFFRSSEGFLR